jgi:hypothetical protein
VALDYVQDSQLHVTADPFDYSHVSILISSTLHEDEKFTTIQLSVPFWCSTVIQHVHLSLEMVKKIALTLTPQPTMKAATATGSCAIARCYQRITRASLRDSFAVPVRFSRSDRIKSTRRGMSILLTDDERTAALETLRLATPTPNPWIEVRSEPRIFQFIES